MKNPIAICLMTIILAYVTVGDLILVRLGVVSPGTRSDADIPVLTSMVAAMVWWIGLQFGRWRLGLWFRGQTYIGILVAILGGVPLSLVVSRIDVGLAIYLPEIIIVSICAKAVVWGFWLWLISGDNLREYVNQQKDPI